MVVPTRSNALLEMLTSAPGQDLGTLWTARFLKGTGVASDLRLYWGWSTGGSWQASANPRWQFGGEPFLYKRELPWRFSEVGKKARAGHHTGPQSCY